MRIEVLRTGPRTIALVMTAIAAILWALYTFWQFDAAALSFQVKLGIGLFVGLLPLSVYLPRVAVIAALLCIVLSDALGVSLGLATFAIFPVAGMVAWHGHLVWAIGSAAAITVMEHVLVYRRSGEFEFISVFVMDVLFGACIAVGWISALHTSQRLAHEARQRQRRKELAILLHDTVAADLTALTVKLEKLAIVTPERREELENAAHSARKAMKDTRRLVKELGTAEQSARKATVYSLPALLNHVRRELESAGFPVRATLQLGEPCEGELLNSALGQCLNEATANIIKYGAAGSTVSLDASTGDEVSIRLRNRVAAESRGESSNLGLESMSRTMSAVGGSALVCATPNYWEVIFSAPMSAPERGERLER
ncbi:sensor histidine kinase [Corynebacterium sp.]|uniref:sensor histidine kinase n=1 Tax=Corynebacterium sp. TaxID=1720 RepID=UPI0026DB870F|nr:histidine kinase [Corynebacterium sp.]MDO5031981.1 histidine kinase [Corynebacterium sp.]